MCQSPTDFGVFQGTKVKGQSSDRLKQWTTVKVCTSICLYIDFAESVPCILQCQPFTISVGLQLHCLIRFKGLHVHMVLIVHSTLYVVVFVMLTLYHISLNTIMLSRLVQGSPLIRPR